MNEDKVTIDPEGFASCGECTLCCKLLGIKQKEGERKLSDTTDDGHKPIGEWCLHCDRAEGCKIYEEEDKPQVCSDFECWWLQSQRTTEPMDPDYRPDRLHAVIVSNERTITINVPEHRDGSWNRGKLRKIIQALDAAGLVVIVSMGQKVRRAVSRAAADMVKRGATFVDDV